MDNLEVQTCCVCLSNDRKMYVVNDTIQKQNFMRIVWEISESTANITVALCWECKALLRRFTAFKLQAQESFVALQTYNAERTRVKPKTGLQIHHIYNIEIIKDSQNGNHFEVIQNAVADIKKEIDILKTETVDADFTDHYSEDDNTTLIEIKKKKKKVSDGKKKKKKKQKDVEAPQIYSEDNYYSEIEITREEIVEERRRLELAEEYANAVYRCEKCLISFPNGDDMKDHISIKHDMNKGSWRCEWCECTFGSQLAFNYHTSKHTRRFVCAACCERSATKRAALKHYEMVHMARPDLNYEVLQDKKLEVDKLESNLEASENTDAISYPCDRCDKVFRWKTSLRKHAETHRIEAGQMRRPHCETCRLFFTSTSNLQKHVKTSSKHQIQLKLRKLKEDTQTSDPGGQQEKIDQIKSSVTNGRQSYPCSQCDRKFLWRGNLLRHLHSHTARANGSLVCKPCDRSFSSIATYRQHMKSSRKHVAEKDFHYMCSECGKRFASKTRLRDHVNWEHLKIYVHKCPVCQKVFKSHTSLYLHKQVVHKKDHADHLCDHCGKPFPNRAKLRSHIVALHTSEAPYACTTCNARFSWHSCLSRHVRRVHRGNNKE